MPINNLQTGAAPSFSPVHPRILFHLFILSVITMMLIRKSWIHNEWDKERCVQRQAKKHFISMRDVWCECSWFGHCVGLQLRLSTFIYTMFFSIKMKSLDTIHLYFIILIKNLFISPYSLFYKSVSKFIDELHSRISYPGEHSSAVHLQHLVVSNYQ